MNETRSNEAHLRAEIEDLKRQLAEQRKPASVPSSGPSRVTLTVITLFLIVLIAGGFFLGYIPRQRRERVLAAESKSEGESLPVVNVSLVFRSAVNSNLVLPGNIQAVTEGPVLARATGYIKKRFVDIGDRVKEGQVLAEIEALELGQQIRQAQAAVDQSKNAVLMAEGALGSARNNAELTQVTAERWESLYQKGIVSRQDNDTTQSRNSAQQSAVKAQEKAVESARNNVAAAEANLARLRELLGYQTVRAPFSGVVTLRNVDTGVLVNEGSTLLFRIAQTDRLRTYLNVPQADAESVRVGQKATLTVPDLRGRKFTGTVARTANALDPATRTLLVEVEVANSGPGMMPGMYAQADLAVPRKDPPLMIPGDTLVVRSDGPQVAVVNPDGSVHFARIQLGRDFGDRLEVLSGVEEGQQVAVNPSDFIREGVRVKPVTTPRPPAR